MKLSDIDNGFVKKQPDVIEDKNVSNIMDVLKEFGITYDDLENTAMEFYVPHPGIETPDKAKAVFEREFRYAISDPNLQLLIFAALLLEKEGEKGNLPGISKKSFEKDLSFIIADEILGEAAAEYIAGSKGRFEFVRFDKNKPGILKNLGPFLDDIIGGLLGGVSANMYSRAMFEVTETETMTTKTKATETKATKTKATGTKATKTKTTETKATKTKATETKATKTKATGTKATKTKATETKATETEAKK